VDKNARAHLIIGKGEHVVSTFDNYKKKIPDGDAVEYMDLRHLKKQGKFTHDHIKRVI
jgi:hypothetical protein